VLADNKLALNAGWDLEMVSLEIGELGEAGFDLSLTGFVPPRKHLPLHRGEARLAAALPI
jgi:hypothetical protein